MRREYDARTGRPPIEGKDLITELSDDELGAKVTIAVAHPVRRGRRLDQLLFERARRQ